MPTCANTTRTATRSGPDSSALPDSTSLAACLQIPRAFTSSERWQNIARTQHGRHRGLIRAQVRYNGNVLWTRQFGTSFDSATGVAAYGDGVRHRKHLRDLSRPDDVGRYRWFRAQAGHERQSHLDAPVRHFSDRFAAQNMAADATGIYIARRTAGALPRQTSAGYGMHLRASTISTETCSGPPSSADPDRQRPTGSARMATAHYSWRARPAGFCPGRPARATGTLFGRRCRPRPGYYPAASGVSRCRPTCCGQPIIRWSRSPRKSR